MMNCEEACRFVDTWEETGDTEGFEDFRSHLEGCPPCERRFSPLIPLISKDAGRLASEAKGPPDADFSETVMRSLGPRISGTPRRGDYRMGRLLLMAAGILVIFAAGLGVGASIGGGYSDTVDVRFVYDGQQGDRSISLVGDFNSWNAENYPLRPTGEGSVWSITIKLRKSRLYSYGFVIDGVRFVPDPAVPERVEDGFGNFNSLLRL